MGVLPLQVIQQEEERDQVGFRQRQQQVQHAALLGYAVRQSCDKQNSPPVLTRIIINSMSDIYPMFQTLLTDATCEVRVEVVGEERFWQLSEVQLQCPCDGVHIHLTHHYRHIFMICRSKLGSFVGCHTLLIYSAAHQRPEYHEEVLCLFVYLY